MRGDKHIFRKNGSYFFRKGTGSADPTETPCEIGFSAQEILGLAPPAIGVDHWLYRGINMRNIGAN
jgi:hypothetical protein